MHMGRSAQLRRRPDLTTTRPTRTRSSPSAHFGKNSVAERGPGLLRPVAEGTIRQDAAGDPDRGVYPQERAARAEVSERARRVAGPGPVRRLRVPQLEGPSPVVRLHSTQARQDSDEPWELNRRRLLERLGGDQRRGEQLAAESKKVVERPVPAVSGRSGEAPAKAERMGDGAGEVIREGHLGPLYEELRGALDPGVRVDAALPGFRERPVAVDRQAGCVSKKVPQRRSRRSRRLVEVDGSLLERDQ